MSAQALAERGFRSSNASSPIRLPGAYVNTRLLFSPAPVCCRMVTEPRRTTNISVFLSPSANISSPLLT